MYYLQKTEIVCICQMFYLNQLPLFRSYFTVECYLATLIPKFVKFINTFLLKVRYNVVVAQMIAVKHDVTLNFLYLKIGFFVRVFHSPSFDCHCTLNQIVENKLTFFVGFFGCLASLKHNFLEYNRSCFNSTLYFSFTQCRFMLEKRFSIALQKCQNIRIKLNKFVQNSRNNEMRE